MKDLQSNFFQKYLNFMEPKKEKQVEQFHPGFHQHDVFYINQKQRINQFGNSVASNFNDETDSDRGMPTYRPKDQNSIEMLMGGLTGEDKIKFEQFMEYVKNADGQS